MVASDTQDASDIEVLITFFHITNSGMRYKVRAMFGVVLLVALAHNTAASLWNPWNDWSVLMGIRSKSWDGNW